MVGVCTIIEPPQPEFTMDISKDIYEAFHVAMIIDEHMDNETVIVHMMEMSHSK